eukprot:TRINITY_DN1627_c0_g1_i1.p1 TRINITY_DN1627_c0_g1~~TRINITY_DN1627_c0_g1_i1.p1  ORF type:complete len:234 (+),score=77.42 TRINITY_DN1627_c0_g1_i1:71-772(+)
MRRVAAPVARWCTAPRRWQTQQSKAPDAEDGWFIKADRPMSAHEANQWREHLHEDMSWLPEAMWKDGRRATVSEILQADPYLQDISVDMEMSKRTHPLHHGIRAAFLKRIEVLKREQDIAYQNAGLVDTDVPEGLSELQRAVYIELKKKDAEAFGKFHHDYKTSIDNDTHLENRFADAQGRVSQVDVRRYNFEGETEDTDVFTIFLRAVKGVLYIFIIYMMLSGVMGAFVGSW